jgi:hypothetical protein
MPYKIETNISVRQDFIPLYIIFPCKLIDKNLNFPKAADPERIVPEQEIRIYTVQYRISEKDQASQKVMHKNPIHFLPAVRMAQK